MRTVRWLIWELPMKSREKMTIGTVEKTRHCPQLSNTSHGHTAQPTGAHESSRSGSSARLRRGWMVTHGREEVEGAATEVRDDVALVAEVRRRRNDAVVLVLQHHLEVGRDVQPEPDGDGPDGEEAMPAVLALVRGAPAD